MVLLAIDRIRIVYIAKLVETICDVFKQIIREINIWEVLIKLFFHVRCHLK